MAFNPVPCNCDGSGGAGVDTEQNILCDTLPDGTIAGTALAVYTYDEAGNPVGPPTFVDPATGDPYVAQGTLMPCPGVTGCLEPVQFCFTTTATGPVDHPGRQFDITLPINPGFAVETLQIDDTSFPANLTWAVTDADGDEFADDLQAFLTARFPGQTVTVTNPNSGTPVCGLAVPMTVHIECARIDQNPPSLVDLIYNGGRDLVVNPAYLTTPPTNLNGPQFVYLRRQDAGGTLNCTNVANRGWETNDLGDANRDFEIWGQGPGGLQTISNTTPTPRGTPVQEIAADINDTGTGPTIWQTFDVPAAGTLRAVLVHGARDPGEQHRITLSTGDTNDNQVGDIINNVTNPPSVTNSGGPNPWTTFQQDVDLGVGTYTFAISTTTPVGNNRGGLFTDMRVFVDSPGQHATAAVDDDTCVVTTEETTTSTDCQWWSPLCEQGDITAWKNAETGAVLTNAAFWGQAPSPECCTPGTSGGGGGTVAAGNLVHSYEICGVVGGVRQPLQRVVYTDQSGGVLASAIIGADGGPVAPSSWVPGSCPDHTYVNDEILCDVQTDGTKTTFLRKYVQRVGAGDVGQVVGHRDFTLAGALYSVTGEVQKCDCGDTAQVCITQTNPQTAEFISNSTYALGDTAVYNGTTDDTWEWTPDNNGLPADDPNFGPAANAVWYPMYKPSAYPAARWNMVDTDPDRKAGWITPHPDSGVANTGLPGEGPSVPTEWFARARFPMPDNADPASMRVAVTVMNADQYAHGWRFNNGVWTNFTPPLGCAFAPPNPENCQPYTYAEAPVSGAGAGDNFLYMRITETVPTGGSAGVMSHMKAIYDIGRPATRALTQVDNCDGSRYFLDETGTKLDTLPTGWAITPCAGSDFSPVVLCDANGDSFLRTFGYVPTGDIQVSDTDFGGQPFQAVEPVGLCATASESRDNEQQILCDSNGTRFLRTYTYDQFGAFIALTNTTLDGVTPFNPVGAVGICTTPVATDFDFVVLELCDDNGGFLRRLTFNSQTGAVTSTVNTTLAGAPYAPVGTVATCESCCPVVVGEGCSDTGSGRYTALRLNNGTITLIDAVTGAAITPANVVPCDPAEVVSTGVRRVSGIAQEQIKTEFPGLQSITLTVLAGTILVTTTTGVSQPIPAGVSLTWSVTDTDDTSLQTWHSVGSANDADYILNWTYKSTSEG